MINRIKYYFTGLTRNTLLLSLASVFTDTATEMLYPIIPIYLVNYLGATGEVVGLIEGLAEATKYIIQGASGWLCDHIKHYKQIALIGYLLSALSKPFLGLTSVWEGFLGVRLLDRFGTGIRSAPRDALVASSVMRHDQGKAFGLENAGDYLGAFLGPLITLGLIAAFNLHLRTIFYLAFFPSFTAFFIVLFVKEGSYFNVIETKPASNHHHFTNAYWKYLIVTTIFGLGNSSNAFLILQSKSLGISLPVIILIYAGFNLTASLIAYPAGFLSDYFGRRNVLCISFFIFLITYLGFALSEKISVIAFLFILYGVFQGIFRGMGKALAADLVPSELYASGIGWYNSTVGLLTLIASLIAGVLWERVSHSAVFYMGAVFAALGIVALCTLINDKPQEMT